MTTSKYIYSVEDCPRCETLKNKYREGRVSFSERRGDRLANDPRMFDSIDKEAYIQLQMQNLTFPVEVDIVDDE